MNFSFPTCNILETTAYPIAAFKSGYLLIFQSCPELLQFILSFKV
jgi:hypothetical protein